MVMDALRQDGAYPQIVSDHGGMITSASGQQMMVGKTFVSSGSIMYGALYVPGGQQSVDTSKQNGDALHFINETFRHCKPIAATGEGI